MKPWHRIQKILGTRPVSAGAVRGAAPLYAERYLFQGMDVYGPALDFTALFCQFGGARVREGEPYARRFESGLHQTVLVPAGVATYWHYAGAVDYAVFYLPDEDLPAFRQLRGAMAGVHAPMPFSDVLVGASARQLVEELELGKQADMDYAGHLASVLMAQTGRVLSAGRRDAIRPAHIQLARLQAVLTLIHENLASELPVQRLADCAQVSHAHFRRLFQQAMGMPPHRYVLKKRLERAQELLLQTDLSMARIAADCGFSSQGHLATSFVAAHAATPSAFRQRGGGKKMAGRRGTRPG